MNVMLNSMQGNTKRGDVSFPASVNLTGCENLLWKIVNNNGVPNFALPTSVADTAIYIGASGDIAGNTTAAESPDLDDQCRLILDGSCNPGDRLSLSPNIFGRVYVPAAGAGTVYYNFIAEESAIPGQWVLCRRISERVATL